MKPKCPICGAKTTWMFFRERYDLNKKIPRECTACRRENAVHIQQREEGIDVTQFGGRHFNAVADIPNGNNPHFKGVRLA